jgi:acyl carrier protein
VIGFSPDEVGMASRPAATEGPGSAQTPFEAEVARLIVETVHLEIAPEKIDPKAPLFGDGLGLDSIDALEIALAVSQRYGFELKSDDPENERIFGSLSGLAAYIAQHRVA